MVKKHFLFLKALVVILGLVPIILSFVVIISFSENNVPLFFGKRIYLVGNDNPMPYDITTGAALLAKDAEGVTVNAGDIVLCYPADSPSRIALRSIKSISESETGAQLYFTGDAYHIDTVGPIPKSSIVAVCTGYPESPELGSFIRFIRSFPGIILFICIPVIALIAVFIPYFIEKKSVTDEKWFDFRSRSDRRQDRSQ